jgi:hypothetical protein
VTGASFETLFCIAAAGLLMMLWARNGWRAAAQGAWGVLLLVEAWLVPFGLLKDLLGIPDWTVLVPGGLVFLWDAWHLKPKSRGTT